MLPHVLAQAPPHPIPSIFEEPPIFSAPLRNPNIIIILDVKASS